jgi:sugar phosphate isomerase/epimerase
VNANVNPTANAATPASLSYCTLDRSPFLGGTDSLLDQATAAAAAGFTLFTPDIFSLRAFRDAGGSLDALGRDLATTGLQVFDISAITVGDDEQAALDEATEVAGFARSLGATWVQSRVPSSAAHVPDLYARCARRVADISGRGVALEFSPFTPISSITGARALIDAAREPDVRHGVVVDTWHLAHVPDGLAQLAALPPADYAYLQLDDALPPSDDLRADTMHRRALPGEGCLDLGGVLCTLRDHGLDGVVSVEVLSAELRTLPLDEYARRVHDAARRVVDATAGTPR